MPGILVEATVIFTEKSDSCKYISGSFKNKEINYRDAKQPDLFLLARFLDTELRLYQLQIGLDLFLLFVSKSVFVFEDVRQKVRDYQRDYNQRHGVHQEDSHELTADCDRLHIPVSDRKSRNARTPQRFEYRLVLEISEETA